RRFVALIAHQPAVSAEPHGAVGRLLDGIDGIARQAVAPIETRPGDAIKTRHAIVSASPEQSVAVVKQTPNRAHQHATLLDVHWRFAFPVPTKQPTRSAKPDDAVGAGSDCQDDPVQTICRVELVEPLLVPALRSFRTAEPNAAVRCRRDAQAVFRQSDALRA